MMKRGEAMEYTRKNDIEELQLSWDAFFGSDNDAEEPEDQRSIPGIRDDTGTGNVPEPGDSPTGLVSDALVSCLAKMGHVDIAYIASLSGLMPAEVAKNLAGAIYQDPESWANDPLKGWKTSSEYLSGNLKRKLDAARNADKEFPGRFSENVKALRKLIKMDKDEKTNSLSDSIYITLGSPWVPADVIDEFIDHLFGTPPYFFHHKHWTKCAAYQVKRDEMTGSWEVPIKNRYDYSVATTKVYGTKQMNALHIIEKTLNMKQIVVRKEVPCPENASGVKRVVDSEATIAAVEKQSMLIDEFRKWVWKDDKRKKRLEKIFEDKYCYYRRRIYSGAFLGFPGMSPSVRLYDYQKDAAARMIMSANTLLAHDVGAGKTYSMIAAGQEMRRMGISKKNMYVVPNNITGQWERIFHEMYPDARLLVVEPKTFRPEKRSGVTKKIRDEDYDGIIMAYSCFDMIPLSRDYEIDSISDQRREIHEAMKKTGGIYTKLERKDKKLSKELNKAFDRKKKDAEFVYFDEMGITRLFVDEAHNFKNVPIETHIQSVNGISAAGSAKCKRMMDKVHMIQKRNNGGGVILATGTPVTNSVTDVFVFQKYLQSGELDMLDIGNFDSWAGMFAEKKTEFEVDVDTNSYRLVTRFSRFHNLPELTSLLAEIADFHQLDDSDDLPDFSGYTDITVERSKALKKYLSEISKRADRVRNGSISRKKDNMLKITTDGRKAALDLRLACEDADFSGTSKVEACADKAAEIYFATENKKSAQLIFCDISTPKGGFNMYDELRRRLESKGVRAEEIAYIHDAKTEAKRRALFRDVCKGNIRILIGSTFKLGLGVNVQERLVALHHLDVPWRPADMTQREGRILRQGNTSPEVQIYRYITTGSFDAYSWQLLETKQRFICDILSGSYDQRSGSDVDSTVLSYAEVKALAVGNPLVKRKFELSNEISRLRALHNQYMRDRLNMQEELLQLPRAKDDWKERIRKCKEDIAFYHQWKNDHPEPVDNKSRKEAAEKRRELRELLSDAISRNVMSLSEYTLVNYCGFDIVMPYGMREDSPFVWLRRSGNYVVELGDTQTGNLIRIDNVLEGLDGLLKKYREAHAQVRKRETEIRAELSKDGGCAEEIEKCRKEIAVIDEALGVENNG